MKKIFSYILLGIASILISYYVTMGFLQGNMSQDMSEEKNNVIVQKNEQEVTQNHLYGSMYLAGGCFWCIEGAFDEFPGVISAVSGYAGGSEETATYKQVVQGNTQHREAVEVTYLLTDVKKEKILERFFSYIDPYDNGGQVADRGFQYTTAIYYQNEEEKQYIESYIHKHFTEPIATKLVPFTGFYHAEEEHQDYAQKQSSHYKKYFKGSGREDYVESKKE
ncbi:MAG: peptide-methionine (S)-S-oxide reductase MsrA [Candidatus Gracilibacteria bacterium]|nr:peptide-methionine (S)-S-oxide reductase MsrA [Candidatus Gracilibacteria bacterium]